MKKVIFLFIATGVMLLFLPRLSLAVWPPETVFEQEAISSATQKVDTSSMTTPERLRLVIQRLEADEHRLSLALDQLKAREEKLEKSPSPVEPKRETKE